MSPAEVEVSEPMTWQEAEWRMLFPDDETGRSLPHPLAHIQTWLGRYQKPLLDLTAEDCERAATYYKNCAKNIRRMAKLAGRRVASPSLDGADDARAHAALHAREIANRTRRTT